MSTWLELISFGIGIFGLVLAIVGLGFAIYSFKTSERQLQRVADELRQETRELRHLSGAALIALSDAGMIDVIYTEDGKIRQRVTAEGTPTVFPHVRGEGEALPPSDTTS